MNTYQITAALEIAAKNPDGFTVSNCMTEVPQTGYCVASKATQNSFGVVGFLRALAYAIENGLHFGGWLNTDNGNYYFDAVKLFPEGQLNAAVKYGLENE